MNTIKLFQFRFIYNAIFSQEQIKQNCFASFSNIDLWKNKHHFALYFTNEYLLVGDFVIFSIRRELSLWQNHSTLLLLAKSPHIDIAIALLGMFETF